MATCELNNNTIWYERRGQGNRALILLHNGFEDSRTWLALMKSLEEVSASLSIIRYDRPGYGLSPPPEHFPKDLVSEGSEELDQFLTALDIEKPIVIGHCLGAAIALRLAARKPGRIKALVAEACGFYGNEETRAVTRQIFIPWEKLPLERQEALTEQCGNGQEARRFWKMSCDNAVSYVMNDAYDLRPELEAVKAPVLVAAGDRDMLFSVEHTLSGFRALPRAELWISPRAGHDLHRQKPRAFLEMAGVFIKRRGGISDVHIEEALC